MKIMSEKVNENIKLSFIARNLNIFNLNRMHEYNINACLQLCTWHNIIKSVNI